MLERALLDALGMADHLVELAEAQARHDRAQLLGHEEEEVDDVLGRAGKALAEHRVLRRDAHRARVEVALAHHDAAARHERRGREPELVGPEQRGERHVAPRLELPVGLEAHAGAQVVQHEHLVRLREAQLPRRSGVLDRRQRRGTRSAVVTGDRDRVGVRLGHARRDRAHPRLADELDADARPSS